jgi:phosphate uptake regulator
MPEEQHPRQPAAAGARLAVLRASAGGAYDAIVAAEDALGVLAGRRVAAERVLRDVAMLHRVAARAAKAHAQARPGPVALLASRLRAGREWRERRAILAQALTDAEQLLADTTQALADVKQEFAARLQARAEAVTELRRLTEECAAARDELAAAGET